MLVSTLVLLLCSKYYQPHVNIVDLIHACLYRPYVDVFQHPDHQSSGEIPHHQSNSSPSQNYATLATVLQEHCGVQCMTKIARKLISFLLEDLVLSVHHTVATIEELYLADSISTHVRKDCTEWWWNHTWHGLLDWVESQAVPCPLIHLQYAKTNNEEVWCICV